jgi:hypothetical protein
LNRIYLTLQKYLTQDRGIQVLKIFINMSIECSFINLYCCARLYLISLEPFDKHLLIRHITESGISLRWQQFVRLKTWTRAFIYDCVSVCILLRFIGMAFCHLLGYRLSRAVESVWTPCHSKADEVTAALCLSVSS